MVKCSMVEGQIAICPYRWLNSKKVRRRRKTSFPLSGIRRQDDSNIAPREKGRRRRRRRKRWRKGLSLSLSLSLSLWFCLLWLFLLSLPLYVDPPALSLSAFSSRMAKRKGEVQTSREERRERREKKGATGRSCDASSSIS